VSPGGAAYALLEAASILGSSPVTLNPVSYHYDTHGRVDTVTWGSRVWGTTYNATTGWVSSTTAPASLGLTFNTRDTGLWVSVVTKMDGPAST
jgi:hypothetical protein